VRILIAHDAATGGGGVESYLAALIPALITRGDAVAFLHYRPRTESGPTRLQFENVPHFSVEEDGLDAVLQGVAEWRPDVCFSHNMGPLDVDEALLGKWRVVKMMHGFFGTCISSHKAHAFPSVVPCMRAFGASCVALYVPRRCGSLHPVKAFRSFAWNSRQRHVLDRYAAVVVASRYMQDEYARQGLDRARLVMAPLFPTIDKATAPRETPARPTVLFAGRMTDLKGPLVLMEAAGIAGRLMGQPLDVVMAGDGPQRSRVIDAARTWGVRASFPGWVTGEARTSLMRRASIVAVPSLWPEPFGLVGLEAGVHGVPAVAFDVGGISEWLHDGVNGRLVRERGSATAFGRALATTLGDAAAFRKLEQGALLVAARMTLGAHLQKLDAAFAVARA
jgi:glycosyltransferase involved in cell wall biosynthesis